MRLFNKYWLWVLLVLRFAQSSDTWVLRTDKRLRAQHNRWFSLLGIGGKSNRLTRELFSFFHSSSAKNCATIFIHVCCQTKGTQYFHFTYICIFATRESFIASPAQSSNTKNTFQAHSHCLTLLCWSGRCSQGSVRQYPTLSSLDRHCVEKVQISLTHNDEFAAGWAGEKSWSHHDWLTWRHHLSFSSYVFSGFLKSGVFPKLRGQKKKKHGWI